MLKSNRHLLVHGHFYQPPRENPWTGEIDPQYSAAPWENWNKRIADECYVPMARSRVYDPDGRIVDLYNNYAHTDFNFGPTLASWLRTHHPELSRHLQDAVTLDRTFAMAQAYNHIMMPLADARDRHAQIVWGLEDFNRRFGFYPDGMWLPECGIDSETVRALVDHAIKYVILSPHQASKARPFGQTEWRDASMGAIDTRRAYRLFETDGAGRTHFNRFLDVIFYTPGLNLKVSFDHILNRPDDLARELDACYRDDFPGAQLVSIVTDGEIYGHHEKNGEVALSRLFSEIAPKMGLSVVSAREFIRDNPPSWEVKLWNGEDDNGSSWSCGHGMGRWSRDCGCTPSDHAGWNQKWRKPLRDAFDSLRDGVRAIVREKLGGLLLDADDAFARYIRVLLDPTPPVRDAFIKQHAQRPLSLEEIGAVWALLEARHNAMLMYTSCGWFFDELSGLEPVQNMRYALRAAELAQPYNHGENLIARLERDLQAARSNLPQYSDGVSVFRQLVLPSMHSNREIAAAMAICLAADFPTSALSWRIVRSVAPVQYSDSDGNAIAWGSFVAHDARLDKFIKATWLVRLDDFDSSAVLFRDFAEIQGDPARSENDVPLSPDTDFAWIRDVRAARDSLSRQEALERFEQHGIVHDRLPEAVRGMLYRRFSGEKEKELLNESARLGTQAVPFMNRARRHSARVPDSIIKMVTGAFEQEIIQAVLRAVAEGKYDEAMLEPVRRSLRSAQELDIHPNIAVAEYCLYATAGEMLHWLAMASDPAWLESLSPRLLADNSRWVSPQAPMNTALMYPAASELAAAMGKGLALARERLLQNEQPRETAPTTLPLPELFGFAECLGIDVRTWRNAGIQFWDSLDSSFPVLIARDPVGLMAGAAGDRLRRIGSFLGFADGIAEKRILGRLAAKARGK